MTIHYADWLVDESADRIWAMDQTDSSSIQARSRRAHAVQAAIALLPETEQLVVRLFYFEGRTSQQIAEQLGLDGETIEKVRQRAMRRLREKLRKFAETEFGISVQGPKCEICRSPKRSEIEALLLRRQPGEPCREIMRTLKELYGIHILSASTIVSHCKYHQRKGLK